MGPEAEQAIRTDIQSGNVPTDRERWAEAYAKQSQSDFAVYKSLTQATTLKNAELCHSLHYLQMACEKISKAYRFRYTNTAIENLLTSHIGFSKVIVGLFASPEMQRKYHQRTALLQRRIRFARRLAREIELLAPAVERDKSPQNTEYPWAEAGKIIVPCEYSFPNLSLLSTPDGYDFIKVIEIALVDFGKITLA